MKKWRESVLVVVMLLGASVAGGVAPEAHRHGIVARFEARAAGCLVAGSSRPVSLKFVCS
jgi:hypothetical protein